LPKLQKVYTEQQVRALLAQAATAAAPALPADGVQPVEQGEVLVTVSGFTGCGKSAIAGEIEILCRALGLQVQWPDGDSEKNMTHADWAEALEQYKPRVRIVEQNITFVSKKGLSK
jgi:adenylylsulfate kinase-like enzyme